MPRRYRLGTLFLAAGLLWSQTANPRRFTATEVRQEDAIARFHGHVVMRVLSAVIYAEDASFDTARYEIEVRGDAQVTLLNVRAQPDGPFAPDEPRTLTDSRRLQAVEVRQNGVMTYLHGNVVMQMPGVNIYASDVDLDRDKAAFAIHGDSRFVFMKAQITPDDQLGPFVLKP